MYRLALGLALLSVVPLAGCGGGDSPVVIPGDFFPLQVGAQWSYKLTTKVELRTQTFNGGGQAVRTVTRQQSVTVGTQALTAYVIQHVYTPDSTPGFDLPAARALQHFIELQFAAAGGLEPVEAFYAPYDGRGQGTPDRDLLVALTHNNGPLETLVYPQPYLLNPPVHGTAQQATTWLQPMPFSPPPSHMSDLASTVKLLDWGDYTSVVGKIRAVISIDDFSAYVQMDGQQGTLSGRSRVFFQRGVGVVEADWDAMVAFGDSWARVFSLIVLSSYGSAEG